MSFHDGPILGVVVRRLTRRGDERGWLSEMFRHDELGAEHHPVMGYVSVSRAGVVRGPHEHRAQVDLFAFAGPGDFKLSLWDNRPASPTYRARMEIVAGAGDPATILIPAGVVHAYLCLGPEDGFAQNFPNRLFAGPGRQDPVDEIRYEDAPDSPFVRDELARRRRRS